MNWYVDAWTCSPKERIRQVAVACTKWKIVCFHSSESKITHIISLPREAAWAKQLEIAIAVAIAFTHYPSNKNSIRYFASINPSD